MRTEKLYIGAHVSQYWIDVAWLYKENYSYLPVRQFPNTTEGIEELTMFFFGQYDISPREVLFCFESLGRHTLPLLAWLQQKGIPFTEGTPMSKARSKRLRDEENFGAIARILTRYAFLHREELHHGVFPAK